MSKPVRSKITDDDTHEWISFDHRGETYTFDLTWLTSPWHCIYGAGCLGIGEQPEPESHLGCCSHGAHFVDKSDRQKVRTAAARLRDDEWQHRALADELGGPIHKVEGNWMTRVVDGACIFLNRVDHPTGPGCAFHMAAIERGESYLDWKPSVCWQVPLRLDYHTDDNDHTTNIHREWKRRDWGEGGEAFHWWCTEDPRAFTASQPVYRGSRDEIIAMVGDEVYERMITLIEERPTETLLPHPSLRRRAASD